MDATFSHGHASFCEEIVRGRKKKKTSYRDRALGIIFDFCRKRVRGRKKKKHLARGAVPPFRQKELAVSHSCLLEQILAPPST